MDLTNSTILITGATDGVGQIVALRLAGSGARVLLHGRSEEKGRRVLGAIETETGNEGLEYYRADFASLDDVRRMAEAVATRHGRVDVLINNAGVGFGSPGAIKETSADGHELRLAVNYLAPFLLTHLLLPTLRHSVPARIVNVASLGQYPIDFDNVMLARGYDGMRAYRQSKLALATFTFDLAAALGGSGITVNCLHPATFMNTKMVVQSGIEPRSTVEEGADAIVYVATSPAIQGKTGLFFDGTRPTRAEAQAYDLRARQRLREISVRLTGLPPASSETSPELA